MKKLFILITLVVVAIAFAVPGQAATMNLDRSFPGADKPDPDGTSPWLTATFEDGTTSGDVLVTLGALNLSSTNKVGRWFFNLDPTLDPSSLVLSTYTGTQPTPTAPMPHTFLTSPSASQGQLQADGDGIYDMVFDFETNTGDAFDGGESVKFWLSMSGLSASSFWFWSEEGGGEGTYLSAAHILSISTDPPGSTWVGAVPIPPSVLLLGSGLIGLVGFRRKKIAK